jgi:Tfp pilus assembly protein PilN
MIKINLHDYREEVKRSTIQKHVLMSASLAASCVFLILLSFLFEKSQVSKVDMEVKGLKVQVNALQAEVNQVKTMQSKQRRVGTILSGIENLRANQMPATQTLYDVNLSVPDEIWLTKITQMSKQELTSGQVPTIFIDNLGAGGAVTNNPSATPTRANASNTPAKEFLKLEGHALEDDAVARFVERLEKISYFKMVFLYKTELTMIGKTKVRKFSIYCYMPVNQNKTAA